MSLDELANLYEMCAALVSPDEEGNEDRKKGHDKCGRIELCEEYHIDHEKGVGCYFVYYEDHDYFNSFIQSIANSAIGTMTGIEGSERVEKRNEPQLNFLKTNIFEMLAKLMTNKVFYQSFQSAFSSGNPEEQKKWLDDNLSTNHYGEYDAIKDLMKDGHGAALESSLNTLIVTFQAKYQFCC